MLISPTEPAPIRALGETSGQPEKVGCDVLLEVEDTFTGVQRKQFPEDFLASLADGRLQKELRQMEPLHRKILLLEGRGTWTMEGELLGARRFTKEQLFGLIYTIAFEWGVEVLWVKDMGETVEALEELDRWARKKKHLSLLRRPGPPTDAWGRRTDQAWAVHLLQGFPGMGPELAQRIVDHFGGVPLRWAVDKMEDLEAVPGIGKGRAKMLWRALGHR